MLTKNSPSGDQQSDKAWVALRAGGRLTKYKGVVCGVAPFEGSVATGLILAVATAFGGMIASSQPASAGECVASGADFVCSGPAVPGTDVEQSINTTGTAQISTTPGFGMDVNAGYGITVGANGTGDFSFVDQNASVIRAEGRALDVSAYVLGAVSIESNGHLIGEGIYGLYVYSGSNVTSTVINVNDVTSEGYVGVSLENTGATLSFTSTGTVASALQGVLVAEYGVGDAAIAVNDVNAAGNGIEVRDYSTGATSVTATGHVESTGGTGILVSNVTATGDMTIDAATVSGAADGIFAFNNGAGSTTTVTASGLVKGGQNGVHIENNPGSGGITLDAADIEGGLRGVYVINQGNGATDLTAGDVTGTAFNGFYVDTGTTTTDLSITADSAIGGNYGVRAFGRGTGDMTITVNGLAEGTDDTGIAATAYGQVQSLTVNADDTKGALWGIYAINEGAGPVVINSTGQAFGGGTDGIRVDNSGTGLTLNANDAEGGNFGIVAFTGAGAAEITVDGTATGHDGDGVYVVSQNNSTSVDIDVNNASGTRHGIALIHHSDVGTPDNDATITVRGVVNGGAGWGIWSESDAGVMTNINVESGAAVYSDSGNAIVNDDGDTTVQVAHDGSLIGNVFLQGGTDNLTFTGNGWDYSGGAPVTGGFLELNEGYVIDGGAGLDTLNLIAGPGAGADTINGAAVTNWEVFNVDGMDLDISNNYITFGGAGVAGQGVFLTNGSVLRTAEATSTAINGNLSLDAGTSYVLLGDGATANSVSGNLANAGTIDLSTPWSPGGGSGAPSVSGAGDRLVVGGSYVGTGGVVMIDTVLGDDSSTTDILVINGDVSGTTTLLVSNLGGVGATTTDGILVVQSSAGQTGDEFVLGSTVRAGRYRYSLEYAEGGGLVAGWRLVSHAAVAEGALAAPTAVLGSFGRLGTLEQRVTSRMLSGAGGDPMTGDVAWVRVYGDHTRQYGADASDISEISSTFWGLQAGIDKALGADNGTWVFGTTIQAGKLKSDVAGLDGDGTLEANGFGIGGTVTWYGDNGFYVDGQSQINWLDMSSKLPTGEAAFDGHSGTVYSLSAEIGQRIKLGDRANGGVSTLTPQAQLMYSKFKGGETSGEAGSIDLGNNSATVLRLGVTWDYMSAPQDAKRFYAIANVYKNFDAETSITNNGEEFSFASQDTWGEIGIGGSIGLGDNSNLFSEITYAKTFGGSDDRVGGTVGLQFTW